MTPTQAHKILSLPPNSTQAAIKSAYHRLALKYHPDRQEGCKRAQELFIQIKEAYDVLKHLKVNSPYKINIINQYITVKNICPTRKEKTLLA